MASTIAYLLATFAFVLSAPASSPAGAPPQDDLLTVAEASGYTKTASHAEVMDLLDRIEARSAIMRRAVMGTTVEGKPIPLVILANPPVANAAEAHDSGKPIFFAFGDIHAGEVCGKEALLMLTREIALDPDHPLLNDLVIVFAPIYNADGNDKFAPVEEHRRGQNGPEEVGVRPNAQDLDLNRDYIKLEAPESQAMVRFVNEWDPHVIMDLHTTDGSHHRYTLTYETPRHPASMPGPVDYAREEILPAVTTSVFESTGYRMIYYGNYNWRGAPAVWATYEGKPRFGGHYHGLRGTIALLSEAYSYAPFKDRVLCTKAFVEQTMKFAAAHGDEIKNLHTETRVGVIEAGKSPQPDDVICLRDRIAAENEPITILGYEMETSEQGRSRATDVDHDYTLVHLGHYESSLGVARPFAYILPAIDGMDAIIAKLKQHGIEVEPFEGDATAEVYTITKVQRAEREFQGHHIVLADAKSTIARRTFPTGSHIAYTAQPLGTLLVYLLEPEASDGLVAWNFFDPWIEVGAAFPVVRVPHAIDLK